MQHGCQPETPLRLSRIERFKQSAGRRRFDRLAGVGYAAWRSRAQRECDAAKDPLSFG